VRRIDFPRVSVLWLNYNSSNVSNVAIKSLQSVAKIEYPNFEVILVDNGSTDGSEKIIEKYFKNTLFYSTNAKFIKIKPNRGFIGGMNAAYFARDRQSRYVSLLHNDVIARPDYLKKLVSYLENHRKVGAVQGLVVRLNDENKIDSGGSFMDESLAHTPQSNVCAASEVTTAKYVTFIEGTMPVYNVDLVKEVLKSDDDIYVREGYIYYLEDVFLSLMLWNKGYSSIVLPIVTASHYRLATAPKSQIPYFAYRNRIALLFLTNSKAKAKIALKYLRQALLSKATFQERQIILDAWVNGIRLGRTLRRKYGIIDLYKAPLSPISIKERVYF
jgi:GT2 family glycosyltransferase